MTMAVDNLENNELRNLLDKRIEVALNYLSQPSKFYRMIGEMYFQVLRAHFGEKVVIGGSIVGSVARRTAKMGSDIDGAIYLANEAESKIEDIKRFQKAVHRYVQDKVGWKFISGCDFSENVFTMRQALSGHLTGSGPRIGFGVIRNSGYASCYE